MSTRLKLSEATCTKQVAFRLKTKEGLFLGPQGLSESCEQRQKLRPKMEPKHRCLVHTSNRNPVCTRHGKRCLSVVICFQPRGDSSDSADSAPTSPTWYIIDFKTSHSFCVFYKSPSCQGATPEIYLMWSRVIPEAGISFSCDKRRSGRQAGWV